MKAILAVTLSVLLVFISFWIGFKSAVAEYKAKWPDGYYGQVETLSPEGFAPSAPFRVGQIWAVTNGWPCRVMWPLIPITP